MVRNHCSVSGRRISCIVRARIGEVMVGLLSEQGGAVEVAVRDLCEAGGGFSPRLGDPRF